MKKIILKKLIDEKKNQEMMIAESQNDIDGSSGKIFYELCNNDYILKVIDGICIDLILIQLTDDDQNKQNSYLHELSMFNKGKKNYNSSLSKLLKSHPVFKTSNLIPKTDFLNAYVKFKINDFDYRNLITYSIVNNIVYQSFITHTNFVESHIQKANDLVSKNIKIFPGHDACFDDMFKELSQKNIPHIMRIAASFLRVLPGLNELSISDLATIIKRGFIDFHVVTFCKLFINGESYLFLSDKYQFTRKWMIKIRGIEKTEIKFKTAEALNKLNLTVHEKALLIIFLLTTLGWYLLSFIN
jgi:hypothetical protein